LVFFLKLDRRRQDEKMQRDAASDQYLELVEKQRRYYKTVKDFQDVSGIYVECVSLLPWATCLTGM